MKTLGRLLLFVTLLICMACGGTFDGCASESPILHFPGIAFGIQDTGVAPGATRTVNVQVFAGYDEEVDRQVTVTLEGPIAAGQTSATWTVTLGRVNQRIEHNFQITVPAGTAPGTRLSFHATRTTVNTNSDIIPADFNITVANSSAAQFHVTASPTSYAIHPGVNTTPVNISIVPDAALTGDAQVSIAFPSPNVSMVEHTNPFTVHVANATATASFTLNWNTSQGGPAPSGDAVISVTIAGVTRTATVTLLPS